MKLETAPGPAGEDPALSPDRQVSCFLWTSVIESFFGSLKTERVFLSDFKTREDARQDIIDYIEMFYNCARRHSYPGYLSPMEYEKRWILRKVA